MWVTQEEEVVEEDKETEAEEPSLWTSQLCVAIAVYWIWT